MTSRLRLVLLAIVLWWPFAAFANDGRDVLGGDEVELGKVLVFELFVVIPGLGIAAAIGTAIRRRRDDRDRPVGFLAVAQALWVVAAGAAAFGATEFFDTEETPWGFAVVTFWVAAAGLVAMWLLEDRAVRR